MAGEGGTSESYFPAVYVLFYFISLRLGFVLLLLFYFSSFFFFYFLKKSPLFFVVVCMSFRL